MWYIFFFSNESCVNSNYSNVDRSVAIHPIIRLYLLISLFGSPQFQKHTNWFHDDFFSAFSFYYLVCVCVPFRSFSNVDGLSAAWWNYLIAFNWLLFCFVVDHLFCVWTARLVKTTNVNGSGRRVDGRFGGRRAKAKTFPFFLSFFLLLFHFVRDDYQSALIDIHELICRLDFNHEKAVTISVRYCPLSFMSRTNTRCVEKLPF